MLLKIQLAVLSLIAAMLLAILLVMVVPKIVKPEPPPFILPRTAAPVEFICPSQDEFWWYGQKMTVAPYCR